MFDFPGKVVLDHRCGTGVRAGVRARLRRAGARLAICDINDAGRRGDLAPDRARSTAPKASTFMPTWLEEDDVAALGRADGRRPFRAARTSPSTTPAKEIAGPTLDLPSSELR